MSFREKRAWISFVVLLLIFGTYFWLTFKATHMNPNGPPSINLLGHYFLITVTIFVLVEIVLYFVLKFTSPKDARTPKDEREILIELKAARIAFTTIIVILILTAAVIVHMPNHGHIVSRWVQGNLLLLAIVIAQLVKYGVQIFCHRRES